MISIAQIAHGKTYGSIATQSRPAGNICNVLKPVEYNQGFMNPIIGLLTAIIASLISVMTEADVGVAALVKFEISK